MEEMQKLAEMVHSDKEKTEFCSWGKLIAWSFWIFIACGILSCFFPNERGSSTSNSELSKKRQAEKIVKSQLNYPSSYSLQGWAVDGNMVTLEYKAKNGFGMEKTERSTIYVD